MASPSARPARHGMGRGKLSADAQSDTHLDLENPGDLCAVVSLPLVVDGRLGMRAVPLRAGNVH